MGVEAGTWVRLCKGGEVRVGVCVVMRLAAGVRGRVGEWVTLEL